MSSGLESLSREDLLALLAIQQRQIDELKAANAELRARVEELERRGGGLNSQNSSLPPSSDRLVKPERRPKPSSGRPKGKQPGSPGTSLALVERPDVRLNVFPPVCAGCEAVLPEVSAGFTRRQCHDIPAASVQVTETRWHQVICDCGVVTRANVPRGVPNCPYYGPNLAALAVYLLVYQHIPVERCAQLIEAVTGAAVSTGWVSAQLPKTASLVEPSLKLIAALLVLTHVLHADETCTNVAGAKRWLHVAATQSLALFTLAPRSRAGAEAAGVLPNFTGTMVHDALWLYRGFPNAEHQLCVAHVTRELTWCDERFHEQVWAGQIRKALSDMIKLADAAREQGLRRIPPEQLRKHLIYYDSGVQHGLDLHPVNVFARKQSKQTNLLLRLRDERELYLRFTRDLGVPPTNNLAERHLRPIKLQLKISGCHASETGAKNWLAIRSYLVSALKHGLGALDAVRHAILGDPWMPPIALAA